MILKSEYAKIHGYIFYVSKDELCIMDNQNHTYNYLSLYSPNKDLYSSNKYKYNNNAPLKRLRKDTNNRTKIEYSESSNDVEIIISIKKIKECFVI